MSRSGCGSGGLPRQSEMQAERSTEGGQSGGTFVSVPVLDWLCDPGLVPALSGCQGPLPYNDSPGFRVADTLVSSSRPGRAGPLCSLGFKYAVRKRVEREEIIREGLEYKGNVQEGV